MTFRRRLRPAQPLIVEFGRYLAASVAALLIDVAVLLAAARIVHYLIATSLGFVAGAVSNYLLSTRWVFRRRRLGDRRNVEFSIFALVGIAGLLLNDLVMYAAVDWSGLSLVMAKLLAASLTFLFNYGVRKRVLF